jgi:hypothetical protein
MTAALKPEQALRASDPVDPINYLGPAPLLEGEDQEAYNRLLEQMSAAVKPEDVIEEIYVRDIVNFTWESLRWRRAVANLLNVTMRDKAIQYLQPLVGSDAARLSIGFQKRDPEVMAQLKAVLNSIGFSMDAIAAQALAAKLSHIERLNHLAMAAEARRSAALRDIATHRKENVGGTVA